MRALGAARGGAMLAVAVTGLVSPEHRAQALAAGFQEHLGKPLAIKELIETIERLTNRR